MSNASSSVAKHPEKVVAKEQLTAYQRWELASFDDLSEVAIKQESQSFAPPARTQEQIEAQIEQTRQQSYDEGYAAGQQSGHQDGLQQGLQQARLNTEQLQTMMGSLQIAINQIDEQLAQSLLDLSLEIAHKMVLETLKIKPEVMLKIVSTAIGNLPHFNQNAHLLLHPDDAELVREQMGEQLAQSGWEIFNDDQIEPGGCRVETAHSNVDATNPSRWQHVVESIGQDRSWLN